MCNITLVEKSELTRTLKLHYALLRCKAELDQLKSGLSVQGVEDALCNHSELLAPLFISCKAIPLTAEVIKKLFTRVFYSPCGSTERDKEESTYMLFLDLLYSSEVLDNSLVDFEYGVSLQEVLAFFTGTEFIPPLGFDYSPSLRFHPTNIFPTASTCALELTLPTLYHDKPDEFKERMTYGMKNHDGFGLS